MEKELVHDLECLPEKQCWTLLALGNGGRNNELFLWVEKSAAKTIGRLTWHYMKKFFEGNLAENLEIFTQKIPGLILDCDICKERDTLGKTFKTDGLKPRWPMMGTLAIGNGVQLLNPLKSDVYIYPQKILEIFYGEQKKYVDDVARILYGICDKAFKNGDMETGKPKLFKYASGLRYILPIPFTPGFELWEEKTGIHMEDSVKGYAAQKYCEIICSHTLPRIGRMNKAAHTLHEEIFRINKTISEVTLIGISNIVEHYHQDLKRLVILGQELKNMLTKSERNGVEMELKKRSLAFLYFDLDFMGMEQGKALLCCRGNISPVRLQGRQYWGTVTHWFAKAGDKHEIEETIWDTLTKMRKCSHE